MSTNQLNHQILTEDGHAIAVYEWSSPNNARGVVHWLHGMGEHAARYERLAKALNAAGWHLVAHDHRGHGASVSEHEQRGHFESEATDTHGWELVVNDVASIQHYIHAKYNHLPVVLAGHSMGSFIALDYAQRYGNNIAALLLSSSNYHTQLYYKLMSIPLKFELWRLGKTETSQLVHALTFGTFAKKIKNAATPFDWLSRDASEVAKYMADPWCGHDCSIGLWNNLVDAITRMHQKRNLAKLPCNLPIGLIAGDHDPMSNFGRGMPALFKNIHKAGANNIAFYEYSEGRHELLNDRCREEVTEDIVEWLQEIPLTQTAQLNPEITP